MRGLELILLGERERGLELDLRHERVPPRILEIVRLPLLVRFLAELLGARDQIGRPLGGLGEVALLAQVVVGLELAGFGRRRAGRQQRARERAPATRRPGDPRPGHCALPSSTFFFATVSCSALRVRAILARSSRQRRLALLRLRPQLRHGDLRADQIGLLEGAVEHLAHLIVFVLGAQRPGLVEPGPQQGDLVARRLELVEPLEIGGARSLGLDLPLQIVFLAGLGDACLPGRRCKLIAATRTCRVRLDRAVMGVVGLRYRRN